jgi:uncharacterized protein (DUF58 family)
MITAQRIVILLLAISLLAGAMSGEALYYRLAYLWGLLLIFSWAMSRLALRGVQVKRFERTTRSQVGQIFEERYEIHNTSRLPRLWIEVRDEASLPGSHGSHVLTLVGGGESRTYLSRTRLTERGVFQLGPTVLISGDLFGLFPVERVFPPLEALLVYPMLYDVRSFPNPPGLLTGGEALRRRTEQITSNAAGVREYATGDPINRIHWVSTARRGRLMVKEFELDPLAEVWIFVDAARTAQVIRPTPRQDYDPQDVWRKKARYELPPSTLEYGVSAAASLARFYLQKGRAVGLVSAGRSLSILPADRGARQLGKILEALALVQAEGSMPIQNLMEAQARHLPRGSTVIIVTPSTDQDLYRTTETLTRRGLRPVCVLLDGMSFGGTLSSERISAAFTATGVPVCKVTYGDDLAAVLSSATGSPQWT